MIKSIYLKYLSAFSLVFFLVISLQAQNLDSLFSSVIKSNKTDTTKISAIEKLTGDYFNNGEYDKCISCAKQGIILSQSNRKPLSKGLFLHYIGKAYYELSNYTQSLNFYQQAFMVRESIGDSLGMAKTLGNMGNVYVAISDYPKALDMELKCVKVCEKINAEDVLKNTFTTLGNIYSETGDYAKSLEYHNKSLKIEERLNNKDGIAQSLGNIGKAYVSLKDTIKAVLYQEKSLAMAKEIGDKYTMSNALTALGGIYQNKKEYEKALHFFLESKKICAEADDKTGILTAELSIASLYATTGKYKEAEKISLNAIKLSKELGTPDYEMIAYNNLTDIYDKLNTPVLAYKAFKKFILLKDSINSETNQKALVKHEMSFEFEKKETLMKADEEKRTALSAAESKRQKLIIYGVSLGLLLVLILIFVVFRSLNQSKNQNKIIESQKIEVEQKSALVEHKQKEIIDSITYAKRLQQAILPAQDEVKKYLPESFLYYNPKDIVAGDFYWLHTAPFSNERGTVDDVIYIAAADCTGHGVPGAMVSVVCSNALNRAVKEFALTETGDILDKVRELVIETFEKSDKDVKDGMDISLARIKKINEKNIELQWSGANNSLWYVQNNELIEIKANKQPIGKYNYAVPFTTNTQLFESSVSFYLFSDGYADQFSKDNKKLMKKKFKDIVLSVQDLPMHEQGQYIEKFHVDWKGDMEQTDDVLVIGVKV